MYQHAESTASPFREIRRSLDILYKEGDVGELRCFGKRNKTYAGFFDDLEKMAEEACGADQKGYDVYVTLNPCKAALLGRVDNELIEIDPKRTPLASDRDIERRRWILADFDPECASKVSSTAKEKDATLDRARETWSWVKRFGITAVPADSGNGAHLLIPVDLPNDAASRKLVEGFLKAVSFRFSDASVKVDESTFNAARITKPYGVYARKGQHVERLGRVHRPSKLLATPLLQTKIEPATPEQLKAVAETRPEDPPRQQRSSGASSFDLHGWMVEHDVPVKREGEWGNGGYRWILEECIWNGHADNSAYVVQGKEGWIHAGCSHDSCKTGENRWFELREHFEPGAYDERRSQNGQQGDGRAFEGFENLEIEDVCADNIETKPVEWLWYPRIPKGKLTMFDGDPDLGKSVVALDIAARVSTGRPFPDGAPCERGNVLIVNVEDGIADTIVPRLKAHGADLERVFIFNSVPDGKGGTRLLELPQDIALLENKVRQRKAALLIIDPVLTMLGMDANKDQDARKALAPIRDMAERTGVAVPAIRHLNKSVGLKAIQRGGGNMGLIGVARAGSFFSKDPEDGLRRIMAPHKSNLAEKPPSLAYRIVTSQAHYNTARVEWLGVSEHDADSLAADASTPHERSQLDDAKEFLREELADGPMWAKQVFKEAREAGVAEITLRRAKTALGVKSEREGTEGWKWRLSHGGGEDDHAPPDGDGDQKRGDDRDDHVDHVDHLRPEASEDFPYFGEDDQDDQDDQGDHRDQDDHEDDHLAKTLDNPPAWLKEQLKLCREDPERYLNPTATSLAFEVFGTATRHAEAYAALEACLGAKETEG